MKPCKTCGEFKELREFPKAKSCKDGHTNKCKTCTYIYRKQWAVDNPGKVNKPKTEEQKQKARERAKKWYSENTDRARAVAAQWRENNPEKMNAYRKKWAENNKHKIGESAQRFRAENPIKYHAHCIVSYAITTGKLVNPRVCSECGSNNHIVAHHDDYLEPLTVRWLCQKCHMQWHSKNEALNAK